MKRASFNPDIQDSASSSKSSQRLLRNQRGTAIVEYAVLSGTMVIMTMFAIMAIFAPADAEARAPSVAGGNTRTTMATGWGQIYLHLTGRRPAGSQQQVAKKCKAPGGCGFTP